MKHRIIIIATCVALVAIIAAAICLLPLRKQMDLTFHGVQLSSDGTVVKECDMDLHAIRNDYLFRRDNYKSIEITVPGYQLDTSGYRGQNIDYMTIPEWPFEYVVFSDFIETHACPISICLDSERQWCAVKVNLPSDESLYFIGSTDPDIDPLDIWEQYISDFLTK